MNKQPYTTNIIHTTSASPYTTITSTVVSKALDKKILNKILLLHNNLMQYYNIPYDETLIKYRDMNEGDNFRSSVYFTPKDNTNWSSPLDLTKEILETYLKDGIISTEHMKLANNMWKWLLKKRNDK